MRRFALRYILLLLAFALLFFAITNFLPLGYGMYSVDEEETPPRYHMQVILKSYAEPPDFWRIVEMGVAMAAAEFDVACHVVGPERESDIEGQIKMVEAAIAQKPDAILLAASDYQRLAPVCEAAVEAGIPVVMMDSDVAYDGTACFVGTDNYELGQKLGAEVSAVLKPGQRFGVVGHVEGTSTAIERSRGLLDAIPNSAGRMAALEYCDGSVEVAKQQTIDMLRANPNIGCMVGLNESSALGICAGLEAMGLAGTMKLVACDSSEQEIKYMENGTIQAFVIQNPFNMGYLGVQAAFDLLEGRAVERTINTGSVTITRQDMYRPENQKLLFPFTNIT